MLQRRGRVFTSTGVNANRCPSQAGHRFLSALTFGDIPSNRLLINVPPGFMKSLLVDVFWPAWEWGQCNMPHTRYIAFSYSDGITTRDNNKMVRLLPRVDVQPSER
jgi:hypothetical protein